MRHFVLIPAAVLILLLLVVFPPWGTSYSQSSRQVAVSNFPNVQRIEGEVTVAGLIRQAKLERRTDVIVTTVAREDVTDLIEAEPVSTDGFSQITVSLHGEARGAVGRDGSIGVILIPDEPSVQEMLNDYGIFHFPIEVQVGLVRKGPAQFNVQQRFDLGFGRYRVFLYNSTDRTADVNAFLYLTQ
jgi:hypothetical protein